ncbi:recombinase family protein [Microbacterium sp.]|uniref:recombinase family protein n=1 Tax=Microbacterium sp. TaxID=51671 RepID=UPI003A94B968
MARLRPVTTAQPRAIIYLRQSIHRDESISLELQEIACRDYCDRMGYDVTAVEADPGISGRTWNRPAVQRVMTAIDQHAAEVVVLWKWSRLSRSRKDWALAIDRADIAGGRIESATEPIDTATASGRFARGVMTEYAAFQSEQIGEQWEEVRQRRLGLGLPASGRLPFGWDRTPDGIRPNPNRAPLVVEMYRRYLSGDGSSTIATWLNESGIPAPNGGKWSRGRPLTVMNSPIHAGLVPYRGNTYPGQHDPIIDRATWDAYQTEHARRRDAQEKPRPYAHLLSTLVTCGCGARMHGKGSITGGKEYRGYLCGAAPGTTGKHRAYVSALLLDPLVESWLLDLNPDANVAPLDVAAQARHDAALRAQNELETERANLTRQLAKGIVPEAAYVRASTAITAELTRLDAELAATAPRSSPALDIATAQQAFPLMTITEKNRTLRQLIDHIHIGADEITLHAEWGKAFLLV